MARSVPYNQMAFLSSSVKLEHTHLCSVSFISLTLTFHLRTASPQLISIQMQTSFSLWGGKKGLISLSLVKKNHHQYSYYLTPWAQHTHICTITHCRDPIFTNPVDMMQGELENRCSLSDLQKPFNSFSLHDFPFYPFKSTYNGTQGCWKWRGLSAWVRREPGGVLLGGGGGGGGHLHFSSSDPRGKKTPYVTLDQGLQR